MDFFPIWTNYGVNIKKNGKLNIDESFSGWGYVNIWAEKTSKSLKVLVKKDKKEYAYDLNSNGEKETFPLQMGEGRYQIRLCEKKSDTKYKEIGHINLDVIPINDFSAFLCPNQYINYNEESECVKKANDICKDLKNEREKVSAIKKFMEKTFMYDYIRALLLKKAYISEPDSCLQKKSGVCLDFATLFAAMARSQGIPTKVAIGYLNKTYHAWNSVYIDGKWLRLDITSIIQGKATKDKVYKVERVY